MLRVELRQRAVQDIEAAVDWYVRDGDTARGNRFVDDVEAFFAHLARHALTGSLRYASELDIPELRTWPLGEFPFLVFYVARADGVDIWRVLHARRDLPSVVEQPDAD